MYKQSFRDLLILPREPSIINKVIYFIQHKNRKLSSRAHQHFDVSSKETLYFFHGCGHILHIQCRADLVLFYVEKLLRSI